MSGSDKSRVIWSAADQAVSSLTNFAVNILILRSVSVAEYGIFVLAFSVYTVSQGLVREMASTPLFVHYTTSARPLRDRAISSALGVSLAMALLVGGTAIAVAPLLARDARTVALVIGLGLPGLLLQDTLRMALLAEGRAAAATANDALWGLLQVSVLLIVLTTAPATLPQLVGAWSFSAMGAVGLGFVQLRRKPNIADAPSWIRRHRTTIRPLVSYFGVTNGGRHLGTYAVAFVAGLEVVGVVGAAQMLLGPLNVLFMAASILGVPEGARLLSRSLARMASMTKSISWGLTLVTAVWTGALLLLPDSIGTAIFGPTWAEARSVVWLTGFAMMGAAWSLGARIGLKVLDASRHLSRIALIATPIGVTLRTVGAASFGAIGAIGGMALTNIGTSVALNVRFAAIVSDE